MVGFGLVTVELVVRAYKSLSYDGVLHVTTSSINKRPHPKDGWFSPTNQVKQKSDARNGSGTVSYNTEGFRAP